MAVTIKIIVMIKVSVKGMKRLLKGLSRQVSEFIKKFTRTRLNRWALFLHLKTMQKTGGCATNHQSLLKLILEKKQLILGFGGYEKIFSCYRR